MEIGGISVTEPAAAENLYPSYYMNIYTLILEITCINTCTWYIAEFCEKKQIHFVYHF